MPASEEEKEFVTYLIDLMQSIGPVSAKGMFGGHGVFLDGLMFGLVADSVLYLKCDKESEDKFKAKELEAFTYHKNGKEFQMSYRRAPEETLEDSDEMNIWANIAFDAALRNKPKKKK